jgi:hypothetical protein
MFSECSSRRFLWSEAIEGDPGFPHELFAPRARHEPRIRVEILHSVPLPNLGQSSRGYAAERGAVAGVAVDRVSLNHEESITRRQVIGQQENDRAPQIFERKAKVPGVTPRWTSPALYLAS